MLVVGERWMADRKMALFLIPNTLYPPSTGVFHSIGSLSAQIGKQGQIAADGWNTRLFLIWNRHVALQTHKKTPRNTLDAANVADNFLRDASLAVVAWT